MPVDLVNTWMHPLILIDMEAIQSHEFKHYLMVENESKIYFYIIRTKEKTSNSAIGWVCFL